MKIIKTKKKNKNNKNKKKWNSSYQTDKRYWYLVLFYFGNFIIFVKNFCSFCKFR